MRMEMATSRSSQIHEAPDFRYKFSATMLTCTRSSSGPYETGTGLDDIEVRQSDGGALHVQNKTSATLATGEKAPLTKTGAQLANWMSKAKASGPAPDPTRNAAVLAVRADAARTLDDLEAGCRVFDLGGAWAITRAGRNAAQRTALSALETIVTAAWTAAHGAVSLIATCLRSTQLLLEHASLRR
jgi:hypothetical protein